MLGLTNTHGAVCSLGHLEPEKQKFPDMSRRSVKFPGTEDDTGVRPDLSGRSEADVLSEQFSGSRLAKISSETHLQCFYVGCDFRLFLFWGRLSRQGAIAPLCPFTSELM